MRFQELFLPLSYEWKTLLVGTSPINAEALADDFGFIYQNMGLKNDEMYPVIQ